MKKIKKCEGKMCSEQCANCRHYAQTSWADCEGRCDLDGATVKEYWVCDDYE